MDLTKKLEMANDNLKKANDDLASSNVKIKSLEDLLLVMRSSQNSLLDQLNTASVINKSGAESIKKSLEAISQQSQYIKDLTKSMQYKDSVNLALALNLKKSLSDFNDSDVSIEVKKGVVYISLSDNMLFKTASGTINSGADKVLAKIAGILNDQSDLDNLVEGHTDNVPIANECLNDNWDLSAKRATAVVRTLQTKYKVNPTRMTAGGRSEFVPKASNANAAGKAENRRTENGVIADIHWQRGFVFVLRRLFFPYAFQFALCGRRGNILEFRRRIRRCGRQKKAPGHNGHPDA